MSIDISSFNPRSIPETEEKQLYREQAIPTSVRFVQNYVENAIENGTWEANRYCHPDMFFTFFEAFCNAQREQKKWSAKKFQMSIAKHLGLKAGSCDRTNNGNVRFYDFGELAEQYSQGLTDKKLHSSF